MGGIPYKPNRQLRAYGGNRCPCCGHDVDIPGQIMLWEDGLMAVRGGIKVPLLRPEFMALRCLLDAWPHLVAYEEVIEAMWGDTPPPSIRGEGGNYRQYNLLSIRICYLRRQIEPLGMAIPRGNANAYRIHVEEWPADSPYLRVAS